MNRDTIKKREISGRIKVDRDKCIGCLGCMSACIVSHDGHSPRNRVVISSDKVSSPIFCQNCDLPECTYTCMCGAMHIDPATGFVLYDADQCGSCYMCVMGCPYGVLRMNKIDGKISKCDMCVSDRNGQPQCVDRCPMGAIAVERGVQA
ncbi:MAG: 4Fe-4S dicluster domain-containing protein [Oscillospiraceae bacterium]|nr:4Fe-4S dicluster domain-containing protein [Oscillospiraceae bacterium]